MVTKRLMWNTIFINFSHPCMVTDVLADGIIGVGVDMLVDVMLGVGIEILSDI